jgi:glycosyltransferase involved in cell wall biosynthesis
MWHILENLMAIGCRVAFIPDDFDPAQPYTEDLQALGVEVIAGNVDVPAWLAELSNRLELVIVSRPYVAARYIHMIRRYAPRARIVYDTVDLHFVREQRRAESSGDKDVLAVSESFRHLELAMVEATDVTIVVSEAERARLAELGYTNVEVISNANPIWDEVPGPEGREGVLFVGGFQHDPNVSAAIELAKEVMPRVWQELPEVKLTIVGGDAPEEVLALDDDERVEVAGWVHDIDPLLRAARVSAAPLRYGAGVKGKVTQSLACGLPVVTTGIGAEGLHAENGVHMFIEDDATGLAARIIELHRDEMRWRGLSEGGRDLVAGISSPEAQREALKRLLG